MSEQLPACRLCGAVPYQNVRTLNVCCSNEQCPMYVKFIQLFSVNQWCRMMMTPPPDVAALTAERDRLRARVRELENRP